MVTKCDGHMVFPERHCAHQSCQPAGAQEEDTSPRVNLIFFVVLVLMHKVTFLPLLDLKVVR